MFHYRLFGALRRLLATQNVDFLVKNVDSPASVDSVIIDPNRLHARGAEKGSAADSGEKGSRRQSDIAKYAILS
jgi:hypothetical protein